MHELQEHSSRLIQMKMMSWQLKEYLKCSLTSGINYFLDNWQNITSHLMTLRLAENEVFSLENRRSLLNTTILMFMLVLQFLKTIGRYLMTQCHFLSVICTFKAVQEWRENRGFTSPGFHAAEMKQV